MLQERRAKGGSVREGLGSATGVGIDLAVRGNLADTVVERVAHEDVAGGVHGDANGVVEASRGGGSAVAEEARHARSGVRGYVAVGRDLADPVIARVGDVERAIWRGRDALRPENAGGCRGAAIANIGVRLTASDRGQLAIGGGADGVEGGVREDNSAIGAQGEAGQCVGLRRGGVHSIGWENRAASGERCEVLSRGVQADDTAADGIVGVHVALLVGYHGAGGNGYERGNLRSVDLADQAVTKIGDEKRSGRIDRYGLRIRQSGELGIGPIARVARDSRSGD